MSTISNFFLLFVAAHDTQRAKYVWNKTEFDAVNAEQTDFLLGKNLFSHDKLT